MLAGFRVEELVASELNEISSAITTNDEQRKKNKLEG
jgi:hypothetical protein